MRRNAFVERVAGRCAARAWWQVFVALLLVAVAGPALAQVPKAKAKAKPKPAAADAADAPAPAKKASKPAAKAASKPDAKADEGPAEPPPPMDPAAEAVINSKPGTPEEFVRAINALVALNQPGPAKKFLKQLSDALPDEAAQAAAAELFGQDALLRIAGRADLQPEGRAVAQKLMQAAGRQAQQPDRLQQLIHDLQSDSSDTRYEALMGFQRAGAAGATALLRVLADGKRSREHAMVRAVLARLGSPAVGPLVAALEAGDPALAAQVVEVLAQMQGLDTRIYLVAPLCAPDTPPEVQRAARAQLHLALGAASDRQEAVRLLTERAKEYYLGRQTVPGTIDNRVDVWRWDPARKQLVSRNVSGDAAARMLAVRLARDAYRIEPHDPALRTLYLTTLLEEAAQANGLDKPLVPAAGTPAGEAARYDANALEAVLQEALRTEHPAAATAAVRLLADKGNAGRLLNAGATLPPLVQAARHPDRRLRMAAVETILHLNPTHAYPGSSYVTDALSFFAATHGTRRILLGGPMADGLLSLSGNVMAAGYVLDTAMSGREVIAKAIASPDYEIILLDMQIDRPPVDPLVQELRRDARTAGVPIGLLAREGYFTPAENLARQERLVAAWPRPTTVADFALVVRRMAELGGPSLVPVELRRKQGDQALAWLAQLSHDGRLYNLRQIQETALPEVGVPGMGLRAVAVLENLGTPESQRALMETASLPTSPLEIRKAAVLAFQRSTQHFGILLTTDDLRRQYDRYNQGAAHGAAQDAATQRILGLILDSLESRAAAYQPPAAKAPKEKKGAGS